MRVGVEIGDMMKKAANSVRWGGYREYDEDGGEQCEVGWR